MQRAENINPHPSLGVGVDAAGGPVVDPTKNVIALTEAEAKRQDDLRDAERRYNDLRDKHQTEIADIRERFTALLNNKESSRVDSIRQVDNLAIATLAKQTAELALTLQTQVSQAAQAAEARRSADMSEIGKRVGAIELANSANTGKQQVADPIFSEMIIELKNLRNSQMTVSGKSSGYSASWIILLGAVALLSGFLSMYAAMKSGASAPVQITPPVQVSPIREPTK